MGILAERILELKFFPEVRHGSLRGVFVAENPAVVVLGFDDKDAVARHQHVIDLRGAVARRHDHVVKASVHLIIQMVPQSKLGAFSPSQPLKSEPNIIIRLFSGRLVNRAG